MVPASRVTLADEITPTLRGLLTMRKSWHQRNASTGALSFFMTQADQSTYLADPADAGSVITVVA